MISCRAGSVLLVLLLAAAPVRAQSPDSVTVSGEELQTLQRVLDRAGESMNRTGLRMNPTRDGTTSEDGGGDLASVLFVFFAIAVVFEAAMSAIFDWRIFIRYFEGRGVKTVVLVGTALVVTFNYDLDILHQILDVLNQPRPEQRVGEVITALLISGGSSAVFRVYTNLGIRDPAERERKAKEERAKMAEDEAAEQQTNDTTS